MTRNLRHLRLRLGGGQSQVGSGVECLANGLGILTVELSQCRSSTDDLLVLVGTGEVIQSEEVHLFGAPDVTAGQPCVSAKHKSFQRMFTQSSQNIRTSDKLGCGTKSSCFSFYTHTDTAVHVVVLSR